MVELYHGSQRVIERPVLGAGNPHNDYGPGFYCTKSCDMACEWACTADSDGYANRYQLDEDGLTIFDLSSDEYHILNWLAILLQNRIFKVDGDLAADDCDYVLNRYLPPYESFDVIVGYRADDSYFSFASAFLNGAISVETLGRAMRLGGLGRQTVLRSQRAFEALSFMGVVSADCETWYPRKSARDRRARAEFQSMRRVGSSRQGHFALDMLREEWGNDAAWLR